MSWKRAALLKFSRTASRHVPTLCSGPAVNVGEVISVFIYALCRYDPSTGIYGMDFFVVLERPGYRVTRRRRSKSRVGIQHRVTKEDAMKWFQVKFEGVILNKAHQQIG